MSTDDSPEREFDLYDRDGFPKAPLEDAEGTSNVSDSESEEMSNPSISTEKPKPCRTPRREVWWLDLGAKNQNLESIKRRFEDCLDRFLSSSSNSLLRHITSPMDSKIRHNLHQCPGYLREEITLASDVSKSAIISHAFPSQSEVCSICGQLVQYKCTEPSIIDEELEANSPNGSKSLPAMVGTESSLADFSITVSHLYIELLAVPVDAENPINNDTSVTQAVSSQSLARKIGRASKPASAFLRRTVSTKTSSSTNRRKPFEPVSVHAVPTALLRSTRPPVSTISTSTAPLNRSRVTSRLMRWLL
jgi:hypothetical protein